MQSSVVLKPERILACLTILNPNFIERIEQIKLGITYNEIVYEDFNNKFNEINSLVISM